MRRAAATAANRQAVINAARELLATVPWREFTLEAVAGRAGVTRVTVYNQVRNKAGLLDAVLTELTGRAGMDQLLTGARDMDPAAALAFVVGRTCRFWYAERAVLRPLFGLAAVDEGIAEHLAGREERRREQFRRLLPGQGEAEVAAVVAVTSFPAYDALGVVGDDPEQAAGLVLRMVLGVAGAGAIGGGT
jgi:AcrR family transcriptional regulator